MHVYQNCTEEAFRVKLTGACTRIIRASHTFSWSVGGWDAMQASQTYAAEATQLRLAHQYRPPGNGIDTPLLP